MKVNMPITDNELIFDEKQQIVSKTDLQGKITYINQDFVEISGFDELIGQDHNIVRHPDMPGEAFKDLWAAINKDKPWVGMTPVRENGTIIGHMSVRKKPEKSQIEEAKTLYASMRDDSYKPSMLHRLKQLNVFIRMRLIPKLLFPVITVTFMFMAFIFAGIDLGANGSSLTFDPSNLFTTKFFLLSGGMSATLALIISLFLSRCVNKPIRQCITIMNNMAEGKYNDAINIER